MEVSDEIRKYMSELGKKGSATLLKKYGKQYFKNIRAKNTKPSAYNLFFAEKMHEGYTPQEIGKMWQERKRGI